MYRYGKEGSSKYLGKKSKSSEDEDYDYDEDELSSSRYEIIDDKDKDYTSGKEDKVFIKKISKKIILIPATEATESS
jgi:hypothetical protein